MYLLKSGHTFGTNYNGHTSEKVKTIYIKKTKKTVLLKQYNIHSTPTDICDVPVNFHML